MIRACDIVTTFEELHNKLLDHESHLKHEEAKNGLSPIIAQVNQKGYNEKNQGPLYSASQNSFNIYISIGQSHWTSNSRSSGRCKSNTFGHPLFFGHDFQQQPQNFNQS